MTFPSASCHYPDSECTGDILHIEFENNWLTKNVFENTSIYKFTQIYRILQGVILHKLTQIYRWLQGACLKAMGFISVTYAVWQPSKNW